MVRSKQWWVAFALLSAACGSLDRTEADKDDVSVISSRLVMGNGINLNGINLNGINLNGINLNGINLNGASLDGMSLEGTVLKGRHGNGAPKSGEDFVGAMVSATLADGTEIMLRIDDIEPSSDPEILLYTVMREDGPSSTSICGYQGNGAPIKMIPLSGHWDPSAGTPTGGDHIDDPSTFTFACVGSTLAKCTQAGYKPWKSIMECKLGSCHSLPLRAFHQACTRMIRADFCGDGQPHTENGLTINVWDHFSIQTRAPILLGFLPEAEWSPDGAVCVANFRHDPVFDGALYVTTHCPSRLLGTFPCFTSLSTFYTQNGYNTPLESRTMIKDEFLLHL